MKEEFDTTTHDRELEEKIQDILETIQVQEIIIDFSCINFIDSMGVNAILQVTKIKIIN